LGTDKLLCLKVGTPFVPVIREKRFIDQDILTIKTDVSRCYGFIRKMVVRDHPNKNVKMISHNTKAQHFDKVQHAEPLDNINHSVLIEVLKWKSIQGGSGHDMVNRPLVRDQ
jgi:hypothetical protein